MQDLSDLEVAALVVRAAGREAMRRFRAPVVARPKRSASDPVSDADLAAQAAMVDSISEHRPDDGLLAEERGLSVDGERRWLLDPLDGTLAFLSGLPLWSCAACLRDTGGTRVSAVYDPAADELFCAERGGLATLWAEPIVVRPVELLRSAVVRVWSDPHVAGHPAFLPAFGRLARSAGALQAGGSGSQALAWVACGRLDGWVELYPAGVEKGWDWHPGELLVSRAGGSARAVGEWRIAAATSALADALEATLAG